MGDFQSNVPKYFSTLRAENDFWDVTLVSDDQKQISAHKVVLSSCSEYFKNILKQNKHAHPLICIADINYEDLTNVLDYIYQGEIQIYQEDLDGFLLIAQRLKLDGLLTKQSNEDPPETVIQNYEHDIKDSFIDVFETKMVVEKTIFNSQGKFNETISMPGDSSMDDVKRKVLEHLEKLENGHCRCKLCGKVMAGSNAVANMKKHIETHLEGISFSCRKCGKQFRTRNILSVHNSRSQCHAE